MWGKVDECGMWGNKIKVINLGESHENAIGINIDGLPSGLELNLDDIAYEELQGKSPLSTARSEDSQKYLSGYFKWKDLQVSYTIIGNCQYQDQRIIVF